MSQYISISEPMLGSGSQATVFPGRFNETKVAIKRVDLSRASQLLERETDALRTLQQCDHPNVVKLLHEENDKDFRYFVLELAQASLYSCFHSDSGKEKYGGSLPLERDRLLQLARGLEHIHSLNFIHRDCHPKNVLIFHYDDGPVLKWADFGLVKKSNDNGSASMSMDRGAIFGKAPELWEANDEIAIDSKPPARISKMSDVFAAGCVFFYSLTEGSHPFGNPANIKYNICVGNPVNLSRLSADHFAYHLIESMIASVPSDRPVMSQVVQRLGQMDVPEN